MRVWLLLYDGSVVFWLCFVLLMGMYQQRRDELVIQTRGYFAGIIAHVAEIGAPVART